MLAARQSEVTVRGGYWRWRCGDDCLLFDAGPVGADELPAHAHCDLLTIEASIAGKRLFVDSGVFDYADGAMRRYCRSTAAHNVLQIDGVEQCDVWSRFRMGYRGHPAPLEHGRAGEIDWCRATHNAYRRIGAPLVGRWIACREDGPWLCVDWAEGEGTHELVSRLHVSAEATVEPHSPQAVNVELGGRTLEVRSLGGAVITVANGWYCPDFGIRRESPVLEFRTVAALPACLGWMVQDADECNSARLEGSEDCDIMLHWRNGDGEFTFRPLNRRGELHAEEIAS